MKHKQNTSLRSVSAIHQLLKLMTDSCLTTLMASDKKCRYNHNANVSPNMCDVHKLLYHKKSQQFNITLSSAVFCNKYHEIKHIKYKSVL